MDKFKSGKIFVEGIEVKVKSVLNLPQYQFFNDMIGRERAVKDLAIDAIAGCMSVTTRSKRNRLEALAMLTKARKAIPAMIFHRKKTN